MVGEGAMTTTGSPSNMSSQSICTWMSTDWKHLPERSKGQHPLRPKSLKIIRVVKIICSFRWTNCKKHLRRSHLWCPLTPHATVHCPIWTKTQASTVAQQQWKQRTQCCVARSMENWHLKTTQMELLIEAPFCEISAGRNLHTCDRFVMPRCSWQTLIYVIHLD